MSQKVEGNTKMALKKANDHWSFLVLFFFLFSFKALLMVVESAFLILFSGTLFLYSFSGF